jgi:chaperonin GroEL (HSP60 family)
LLSLHYSLQVGAEIVKKALTYPLKLIAENAGTNGSVVMQRVIDSQDPNYGYNAAIDKFEDLMQSGIIDPTKVGLGLGSRGCVQGGSVYDAGLWLQRSSRQV